MPDPITLGVIGAAALTEGVKFMYSQAGELLKRWRERRDAAAKEASQPPQNKRQEAAILTPSVFEGTLSTVDIEYQVLERLEMQLRDLRKDLQEYAEEIDTINPDDPEVLAKIDALRQVLEVIYQQPITFKGENRGGTAPAVRGEVSIENVKGYVAAVRAGAIVGGKVEGSTTVKEVESGGTAIGVDVETIGVTADRNKRKHPKSQ